MKKILGVLLAGAVALTCFTACNLPHRKTPQRLQTALQKRLLRKKTQKQKQRLFVWRIYTTLVQE